MADCEAASSGKMAKIPCRQSKLAALPWELDANHESNLFNKLCDELVGEILVRLPTTAAAVGFQAVCKRWQWIALPPVVKGLAGYASIGFLCVEDEDTSHHKKFMVVRLCTGSDCVDPTPRSRFKAQVFSSENSLWRTLVVSSPLTLKNYRGEIPLVAYRGMLHWLNSSCIVVYDPLNTPKRFSRVIDLPIEIEPLYIYRNNCFGVSQGCLRVAEVSDERTIDPVLDVWELEDYDSGLWILVHKVHLRNLIHNGLLESLQNESRCFSVLSFHPENGDVIYLRLLNGVVPVNMKTRIIERFYPIKTVMLSWGDAFHLVDQPWPTAVSLLH